MHKTLKIGAMMLLGVATLSSCAHYHHDLTPELPTITAVNNINGSVSAIDGLGIEGATITMEGPSTGTATTDANGYFIFPDVKVGDYKLTVTAPGKIGKSTTVKVLSNASGYNAIWNVLLASEESLTNITVTDTGGEGETTSEALKGNDLAKIDLDVEVPAGALNKPGTLWITPIYSEDDAEETRSARAFDDETMLVGATIGCSDNTVQIENPIDLVFNVDETTAATVKTYMYHNGAWQEIANTTDAGKVTVKAEHFTSYGVFAPVDFTVVPSSKNLTFERSLWDNSEGSQPIVLGNANYKFMVGTDITSKGTTTFTALLIEALARHFGANAFETNGSFPLNTRLAPGAWLEISGKQVVNKVTAAVGSRKVEGTQYGDVSITVRSGAREHTGGTNE